MVPVGISIGRPKFPLRLVGEASLYTGGIVLKFAESAALATGGHTLALVAWHSVLHETESGDVAPGLGPFRVEVVEPDEDDDERPRLPTPRGWQLDNRVRRRPPRRRQTSTAHNRRLQDKARSAGGVDEKLHALRAGSYLEPSKMTLAEYETDEWLPSITGNVRPATYTTYRSHVRTHIATRNLGQQRLQSVNPAQVKAFYEELKQVDRGASRPPGLEPEMEAAAGMERIVTGPTEAVVR